MYDLRFLSNKARYISEPRAAMLLKKPRRVSTLQKKSNFENISNRNTLLIERAHLNIYKIIVYTAIITNIKDVRAHRVVGPETREVVEKSPEIHFIAILSSCLLLLVLVLQF